MRTTAPTFNFDATLHRLRERAEESGYDIGIGYCDQCDGKLTEADVQAGECTTCGESLPVLDESVDEDCFDDGYGDY